MALGKDKNALPVNANVPEHVMVAFEVARARRKMKKQEALAEAMLLWAAASPALMAAQEREATGNLSDLSDKEIEKFLHELGEKSGITHEITPKEIEWVRKLIRIIRSRTQFEKSIGENLDGFCLGLDALEELAELRAKFGDSTGSLHTTGTEASADLKAGIERLGGLTAAARRSLGRTPKAGKSVQSKKA